MLNRHIIMCYISLPVIKPLVSSYSFMSFQTTSSLDIRLVFCLQTFQVDDSSLGSSHSHSASGRTKPSRATSVTVPRHATRSSRSLLHTTEAYRQQQGTTAETLLEVGKKTMTPEKAGHDGDYRIAALGWLRFFFYCFNLFNDGFDRELLV